MIDHNRGFILYIIKIIKHMQHTKFRKHKEEKINRQSNKLNLDIVCALHQALKTASIFHCLDLLSWSYIIKCTMHN